MTPAFLSVAKMRLCWVSLELTQMAMSSAASPLVGTDWVCAVAAMSTTLVAWAKAGEARALAATSANPASQGR